MIADLQSIRCNESSKITPNRRIGRGTRGLGLCLEHHNLVDQAGTRERAPGYRTSFDQQAGDALSNERFHNSWEPKFATYLSNAEDACARTLKHGDGGRVWFATAKDPSGMPAGGFYQPALLKPRKLPRQHHTDRRAIL